jgi:ribonuclease D
MRYNSRDIINCVDIGLSLEDHQKPEKIEHRVPSKAEEKLADKLAATIKQLAEKLEISPALLMTRVICKRIAAMHFSELPLDLSFMAPWRQELLAEDIEKVLAK